MASPATNGCPHTRAAGDACVDAYGSAVKLSLAINLGLSHFEAACQKCGNTSLPVCCLECDYIGCPKHTEHNHNLGACFGGESEGFMWCFACRDIKVDSRFEEKRLSEIESALQCKEVLHPTQPEDSTLPFHAFTGLRGFINLGSTCYVSVVLQSLVHNPLVRAFFLGGGHQNELCTRPNCLECSVDRVYTQFFGSSSVSGYGITDMLIAMAEKQPLMGAGSTEQDAHEFYLMLLNEFHNAHFATGEIGDKAEDAEMCSCLAHRNFGGSVESTLLCNECGAETTKRDPIVDLGLDLGTGPSTTLDDSLKRFTTSELLANYACEYCGSRGRTTKTLKISQFPPVLLIQLKRFKHFGTGSTKVDTPINFGLQMDVAPYTSTYPKTPPLIYELYGVICHTGSLDTGHYTCMMKHSTGQWFNFDDVTVTPIDVDTVKQSTTAYLLFYIVKWAI